MTQPNSSTTLIAAPQAQDDPLNHPWDRCITVGRGYDLLRADLQEQLRFLQREIGYRHIRFHASFHDDVGVVHRQEDGSIVYRWTQLDRIYDFLIDAGFDPIVEINPMPAALASGDQTMFWYKMNVTPPRDYGAWQDFLRAWLEHFVERYGRERMRKWYFEVWNEPNLRNQFWTGDRAEYYRLYQSCAEVVKAVDSDFPVGGPSGAGAEWNLDFARHCREHGIPVDFISYHCYPQNEAGTPREEALAKNEPGRFFVEELENARQVMAENGFGDLPLLITEWNTQSQGPEWKAKWVGNEHVSDLFAGAAVCYLATACDDLVDMLGWWVASDVFEEAGPHFEPNAFELIELGGVPAQSGSIKLSKGKSLLDEQLATDKK